MFTQKKIHLFAFFLVFFVFFTCINVYAFKPKSMLCQNHDGSILASVFTKGQWGKYVFFWDSDTGKSIRVIKNPEEIDFIDFQGDRNIIITGSSNTIRFWKVSTGNLLNTITIKGTIESMAASNDGKWIAAHTYIPGSDYQIYLISTENGKTINHWQVLPLVSPNLLFADEKHIVSVTETKDRKSTIVKFWNVFTGDVSQKFIVGKARRNSAAIFAMSPDRKILAVDHQPKYTKEVTLQVWNIDVKKCIYEFKGKSYTTAIAFHPHKTILAYSPWGKDNSSARFWNFSFHKDEKPLPTKSSMNDVDRWDKYFRPAISAMIYSPDGRYLFTAYEEDLILWDVSGTKPKLKRVICKLVDVFKNGKPYIGIHCVDGDISLEPRQMPR